MKDTISSNINFIAILTSLQIKRKFSFQTLASPGLVHVYYICLGQPQILI